MSRCGLPVVGSRGLWSGVFLLFVVVLCVGAATGCTTTLRASTTQPNPLVAFPNEPTHRSEKVFIDVRDMELPRSFTLRQSAYFAVVSRERLRFHVMLVHKWKEVADPTSWTARLEDDRGNSYYPESKEFSYDDYITKMWDHERRWANRDNFGDLNMYKPTLGDGDTVFDEYGRPHRVHNERVMLDSVDVFQGAGDLTFHAKDLFNRGVRRLTLTLNRSGVEYKFTWNLVDLAGDEETDVVEEPEVKAPRDTN